MDFDSVEIEYGKTEMDENYRIPNVWDADAAVMVHDLMARHFDNDLQHAADAQNAAMEWKIWAQSAKAEGLSPPAKDDLTQDWVDFIKAVETLKTDLGRENRHMPEIAAIHFPEREIDRER